MQVKPFVPKPSVQVKPSAPSVPTPEPAPSVPMPEPAPSVPMPEPAHSVPMPEPAPSVPHAPTSSLKSLRNLRQQYRRTPFHLSARLVRYRPFLPFFSTPKQGMWLSQAAKSAIEDAGLKIEDKDVWLIRKRVLVRERTAASLDMYVCVLSSPLR